MFILKDIECRGILEIKELEIKSKILTSIIGESGCGKTTLLLLLNKMVNYERGEIFYKNKNLKDIESIELRRKVVMLSQNIISFRGSIKENLLIGLRFSEKELVSDSELIKALKTVRLSKELDEDIKNLSRGEQQRVAIARILLMKPEVILLDEPSSALDETTEYEVLKAIKQYGRENGIGIIMVTHSNLMADKISDEIFEIKDRNIFKRRVHNG